MKHSISRQMWQLNNDYTVTDGAGEVTFSYQVKNGAAWADVNDVPTNVGTYRVKAVVAENEIIRVRKQIGKNLLSVKQPQLIHCQMIW